MISHLRHPFPGSPYGLGGLSRRDRQRQSVPPCLLVLLMQRSPKTLGRPTFATRGDAQARRGRQQAERAAAATSGRTGGDTSAKSFYSFYKRAKPAATQGSPRGREWASPHRKGTSRLFLSPPSFFFTHEKERWGAGGSQPRIARGVVPRIPTLYSIGVNQEATSPFALARRRLMGESEGERCFAGERCSPPTR